MTGAGCGGVVIVWAAAPAAVANCFDGAELAIADGTVPHGRKPSIGVKGKHANENLANFANGRSKRKVCLLWPAYLKAQLLAPGNKPARGKVLEIYLSPLRQERVTRDGLTTAGPKEMRGRRNC